MIETEQPALQVQHGHRLPVKGAEHFPVKGAEHLKKTHIIYFSCAQPILSLDKH